MGKNAKRLRELISQQKIVTLPGSHDCYSAKIIEKMGFPCVYLTGYGAEACLLGRPDLGFMTMTEMCEHASNIAEAVNIPLVSDIDTGYGGIFNFTRTIHAFEKGGIAGVQFEDQSLPKRCGGMAGREVIPMSEMCSKIKAASDTREDPNFVIIARTDAREPHGFEEAKRRLSAYLEAGADFCMISEYYTLEEIRILANEFRGRFVMCCGLLDWKETHLPMSEYAAMGVKIVIFPIGSISSVGQSIQDFYRPLLEKGQLDTEHLKTHAWSMVEINKMLDIDYYHKLSERYKMK